MDSFVIPQVVMENVSRELKTILELTVENFKLQLKVREQQYQLKVREQENQSKFKVQEKEYQTLKDQLCTTNLKMFKRDHHLNVRDFIDYVLENHLSEKPGSKATKFKSLAEENPDLLKKWKISEKLFGDIFDKLIKNINASPHPTFDIEDFVLPATHLEHQELMLLGFIWCAVPLDEKEIYVRKSNDEVVNLVSFVEESKS